MDVDTELQEGHQHHEGGVSGGDGRVMHRFNSQLPSYRHSIGAEADRLLAEVAASLTSFDAERDDASKLLRACSGLDRMRSLKYDLNAETRLSFAKILYGLAFPPSSGKALPWRCHNRVLSVLTSLISKMQGRLALEGRFELPWRPLFAAIDECTPRGFPLASKSNERSRVGLLMQLIHTGRHFWAAGSDREIWDELKEDIRQVQTQGAFKAIYLLCLFLPSRTRLYDDLLPEWFSLWGQVDHCPSWDGAWLTLLCRATKHTSPSFDWTRYMSDMYSFARSTIHTPVSMGDAGAVPLPGGRKVAFQYQAIAVTASRHNYYTIGKVAKMLVFLLGRGGAPELVRVSDVAIVPAAEDDRNGDGGAEKQRNVSPGAQQMLSLFRGLRTYFHPSNGGRWSFEMAVLMHYVLCAVAWRVGKESALRQVGRSPPAGALTHDDAGLVVDALLPLVLEMVYSKDSGVVAIANYCLTNLATLSPKSVTPMAAELILRALDPIASINHTHQAPSAMRALMSIFRPLMYPRPYLAPYLPMLLELTLPGLDANDVFKTTITLQLYHLVLCWVPVQGGTMSVTESLDEWKPRPPSWLDAGPTGETGDAEDVEYLYTACENLGNVLTEWSVALLERIFEILRYKDKSSKVKAGDLACDTMNVAGAMTGIASGGTGSFGSGGGREAVLAGLFQAVTRQLFTMADEPAAKTASAKVLGFVMDRALPNVEKDVAGIVNMMALARPSKTVAAFFPALSEGLLARGSTSDESPPALAPGASPVLLRWRLRLLSGLARGSGAALVPHGRTLRLLIAAGIAHKDKGVRKSARKLLRKALQGLCEISPAGGQSLPPKRWANVNSAVEWRRLCEPVPAAEQDVVWVEPSSKGLSLAAELLELFLRQPMRELSPELSSDSMASEGAVTKATATTTGGSSVWREHLKTMDYAVRGGVCLLSDRDTSGEDGADSARLRDDADIAMGSQYLSRLLEMKEGPRLYNMVAGVRAETTRFMRASLEACAEKRGPADVKAAKLAVRLSQRIACTRGSRAHKARSLRAYLITFKSQHSDVVSSAAGQMRGKLALEAAAVQGDTAAAADMLRAIMVHGLGSGSGKVLPRALFVGRVNLQHLKRQSLAPRALAFAARNAARSASGTEKAADSSKVGGDAQMVPWPSASTVLDRYRGLFSALVQLSSSEYATVRAAAQVGANNVGGVFPWFTREAVSGFISRLSPTDRNAVGGGGEGEGEEEDEGVRDPGSGDAAHRRLTGACYLIHQARNMRHIASKWSLSRTLLLAICDSQAVLSSLPSDKQEKAAARVTILLTSYVSTWRANPINTESDKEERDALQDGLLNRLNAFRTRTPSAGGGWRYQLMASWCLMHLIRPSNEPTLSESTAGRPSMAVWRWFASCLSEGDGQPLQRLALAAIRRLLLSAENGAPPEDGEVSALLSSRTFLKPFLSAIAHNHQRQATEGGLGGADQWSLGVKEITYDWDRGDTRELFPRLRFATRSNLLRHGNARLVRLVVAAVAEEDRAECIRVVLEEMKTAQASTAHEDKRSFDCAAAEVTAGIMAVLCGETAWGQADEVMREIVLPFVDTEFERVSLEGRLDWTDAIRFALDRSTPAGAEPLVSRVVERTMAVLQGGGKGRDNYSVLVKWLSFMGAVLIELSARPASAPRAASIAKDLCPLLVEGLDHPFKACREEIGRNLFLVTNATDAAWAVDMATGVRDFILAEAAKVEDDDVNRRSSPVGSAAVGGDEEVANGIATLSVADSSADTAELSEEALLASAMTMSDGSATEEADKAAAKRLSLLRESVLQWLHQTTGAGDLVRYLPILVALLPVALQCVRDSNAEVAAMGRGACLSGAAALSARSHKDKYIGLSTSDNPAGRNASPESDTLGGGIAAVLSAAKSQASWRVRRNAVAVACVLQTRLHFVLTAAQHKDIDATLLSLLGDERREVQETARLALSTRVAHLTAAKARALCEQFSAGADSAAASRKKRRKLARRQVAGASTAINKAKEPTGAMKEQQTNVLGLSAVVLAAPCDVPPWVPEALESLARHANDESPGRLPVRQTVTHTFKEFRRTHQDKWEESHKARFSRDQLDTFDDVLGGAHSYFV